MTRILHYWRVYIIKVIQQIFHRPTRRILRLLGKYILCNQLVPRQHFNNHALRTKPRWSIMPRGGNPPTHPISLGQADIKLPLLLPTPRSYNCSPDQVSWIQQVELQLIDQHRVWQSTKRLKRASREFIQVSRATTMTHVFKLPTISWISTHSQHDRLLSLQQLLHWWHLQ